VAAAGACTSSSSMSFVGSVVAGTDAYRGQKVDAFFNVYGYSYQGGSLHIVFDRGPRVTAVVGADNALSEVTLTEGATAQAATLVRRP
jgi:hypothetical protein